MNGLQLKEQGQQLVMFKAGSDWMDKTLSMLYVFKQCNKTFTIENFRVWCQSQPHFVEPESSTNVWGAVAKVAASKKHRLIKWNGEVTTAKMPSAHARMIKVWVAV